MMTQLTYLHTASRGGRKPTASSSANLLWVLHVLGDDLPLNVAVVFAHLKQVLWPPEGHG